MNKEQCVWGYLMLWLVVIVLIAFTLLGCDNQPIGQNIEQAPVAPGLKVHRLLTEDNWSNVYYVQFEIDGCEYIHFYMGKGTTIHKTTCKNCRAKN